MQIKTTVRYHYTPTRMAKIKKYRYCLLPESLKSNRNSQMLLAGMQNGTATLEYNFSVDYNAKQSSSDAPRYLLNEVKTYIHTKLCTPLFIITQNGRQSKYSSDE